DDEANAVACEEIHLAVRYERRRTEALADAFLPHFRPRLRIDTRDQAIVIREEDEPVGDDRTDRIGRRLAAELPAHIGRRGIAGAARLDREQRALHALNGVNRITDQRRPGDDAIARERLALPEPLARRHVVAIDDVGAEDDDLVLAVVAIEQG